MGPYQIFNSIKKNRYFLLQSYLIDFILMSMVAVVLYHLNLPQYTFDKFWPLLILVAAVINGMVTASLLHNTSHGNVSGKWLNRLVGEYCGLFTLYGFVNFTMVHVLHHNYSDEEHDPVCPRGKAFITYLFAPMRFATLSTQKYLFAQHEKHSDYKYIMALQIVFFHANILMRFTMWYFLLGKSLFFSFYIPSVLTIIAVFAHIKYVCHRDNGESVDIVNLNHNLYYKVANFFTMGGYYHRNHHLNMSAFNPQKLKGPRFNFYILRGQNSILNESMITSSFTRYFNLDCGWENEESKEVI